MSTEKSDCGHSVLHTELIIKTEGNEIEADNNIVKSSVIFEHQTIKSENHQKEFQIAAVKNEVYVEEDDFSVEENGETSKRDPLQLSNCKCKFCNKFFSKEGNLKVHIRTVHEGHKDHQCEFCNKSFSHAGDLKRHIHTIHEGHKDHKCEYCGKSFSRSDHLKKHIQTVHKDISI